MTLSWVKTNMARARWRAVAAVSSLDGGGVAVTTVVVCVVESEVDGGKDERGWGKMCDKK